MTAGRNSDGDIAKILSEARVFAVIGASNKPERPSFAVMQTLLDKGYTVHPVNPGLAGQKILERHVFATLAEVPAPIDVVDIFRNSNAALVAVREAIALRDQLEIKVIWMQIGVINTKAADAAEAAGLKVVMDRCPRLELSRLAGS